MIGVSLMLLQAFTGINTVIFYSTTIFELAGVENTVRNFTMMMREGDGFPFQFSRKTSCETIACAFIPRSRIAFIVQHDLLPQRRCRQWRNSERVVDYTGGVFDFGRIQMLSQMKAIFRPTKSLQRLVDTHCCKNSLVSPLFFQDVPTLGVNFVCLRCWRQFPSESASWL